MSLQIIIVLFSSSLFHISRIKCNLINFGNCDSKHYFLVSIYKLKQKGKQYSHYRVGKRYRETSNHLKVTQL